MVKKTAIIEAAKTITDALRESFLTMGESNNVKVFESSAGHLRVIVGSDRFKGKSPVERQDIVWDYLEEHVPSDQLAYCSGVHPLDAEEYAAEVFRQTSSASADLFIRGATGPDED